LLPVLKAANHGSCATPPLAASCQWLQGSKVPDQFERSAHFPATGAPFGRIPHFLESIVADLV
jgi:hypothetical protein